MTDRTVALLAGGLGTRVASLSGGAVPKALLPVAGRPFIDHKLAEFRRLGVDRVVMLLAVHSDQIIDHVGDGSDWDLHVDFALDGDRLLGTGGSVKRALSGLPDRFWVTYGDSLLDADLGAGEAMVERRSGAGVMTVLHNRDRWETSNVSIVGDLVTEYAKGRPAGSHRYIDYGYLLLPSSVFAAAPADEFDLSDVLQPLIATRRLHALEVAEPFHEIGTPESLAATEQWLRRTGATP